MNEIIVFFILQHYAGFSPYTKCTLLYIFVQNVHHVQKCTCTFCVQGVHFVQKCTKVYICTQNVHNGICTFCVHFAQCVHVLCNMGT